MTYCDCHLALKARMDNQEGDLIECKDIHKDIYNSIKTKTPNTFFLTLISVLTTFMIFSIGFQWASYEKISNVSIKVAVLESKIENVQDKIKQFHTKVVKP